MHTTTRRMKIVFVEFITNVDLILDPGGMGSAVVNLRLEMCWMKGVCSGSSRELGDTLVIRRVEGCRNTCAQTAHSFRCSLLPQASLVRSQCRSPSWKR